MSFFFLLLLSRKIFTETFLHTLVYNQIYTLVSSLVNIIKCLSILFYICTFYTCLDCLVLTYTCLYMHINIYTYFSIHVCLTIRVYIFVNIFLSILYYQYIFLDILAFIYLPMHTCLYIPFIQSFILSGVYIYFCFFYIVLFLCMESRLYFLSICRYYLLVLLSITWLC